LAVALIERFGIRADLIKSGGGVFEIEVDGQLIFSKKAKGRFPEDHELFPQIQALIEA